MDMIRLECAVMASALARASADNRRRILEPVAAEEGSGGLGSLYSCVAPLRLLLEMERDPEAFEGTIGGLMDHGEERMKAIFSHIPVENNYS